MVLYIKNTIDLLSLIGCLDKEYLLDKELTRKNAIEIKKRKDMKEGERISAVSDTIFKTMFLNRSRIKYTCKLLSYILNLDYEYLIKNLHFTKNDLDNEKASDVKQRPDLVLRLSDDDYILIDYVHFFIMLTKTHICNKYRLFCLKKFT